jgi:hypothetical protein
LAVQKTVEEEKNLKAAGATAASADSTLSGSNTSGAAIMDADQIAQLQHSYLARLSFMHFAHLFLFSGMEFTLTFLTFHLFDFSHMQQGALLGYIGIMSSLLQGGYVRRRAHKVGEKRMVLQGMAAAAIGLGCIALVSGGGSSLEETSGQSIFRHVELWLNAQEWSQKTRMWGLYAGATGLAVTSATVVNCLTSLASLVCDMGSDEDSNHSESSSSASKSKKYQPIGKGLALGRFRSWGQLGRASGPIAACSLYWRVGPLVCYGVASLAVATITVLASRSLPEVRKLPIRTRAASIKKSQ